MSKGWDKHYDKLPTPGQTLQLTPMQWLLVFYVFLASVMAGALIATWAGIALRH